MKIKKLAITLILGMLIPIQTFADDNEESEEREVCENISVFVGGAAAYYISGGAAGPIRAGLAALGADMGSSIVAERCTDVLKG